VEEVFNLFSDHDLLLAARTGDQVAFSELSNRHTSMVLRVLLRITKNKEDAEDALQETLLKAFVHLKTFDGRSSYSTWLTRIAINSALMDLRKKRRHCEVPLETGLDHSDWVQPQYVEPSMGPENLYCQKERELSLRKAIQRLPAVLRVCIEIRHMHDASIQDVANLVGISVAAAKSRLLRARKMVTASLATNDVTQQLSRLGTRQLKTSINHSQRRRQ
jgi:RNA polymerase sigma factor (sigma-70 family)